MTRAGCDQRNSLIAHLSSYLERLERTRGEAHVREIGHRFLIVIENEAHGLSALRDSCLFDLLGPVFDQFDHGVAEQLTNLDTRIWRKPNHLGARQILITCAYQA